MAPVNVISEAKPLATLTSWTLIGGGISSVSLEIVAILVALQRENKLTLFTIFVKYHYLYNKVASFNNSWTALPSDAYSFLLFSFSRALDAIKEVIPVKNSTLSFSNSTRSEIVVSGSYLNFKNLYLLVDVVATR